MKTNTNLSTALNNYLSTIELKDHEYWATTRQIIQRIEESQHLSPESCYGPDLTPVADFLFSEHYRLYKQETRTKSYDPFTQLGRLLFLASQIEERYPLTDVCIGKYGAVWYNTIYLNPDEIEMVRHLHLTGKEELVRDLLLLSYDHEIDLCPYLDRSSKTLEIKDMYGEGLLLCGTPLKSVYNKDGYTVPADITREEFDSITQNIFQQVDLKQPIGTLARVNKKKVGTTKLILTMAPKYKWITAETPYASRVIYNFLTKDTEAIHAYKRVGSQQFVVPYYHEAYLAEKRASLR